MKRIFVPLSLLGLLTLTTLSACQYVKKADITETESEPDVIQVAKEDPKMKAAIAEARKTIPQFIAAFKNPTNTQTDFSLKMPFSQGEVTEHMWVNDLRYDGKVFIGTIGNEPDNLKNVRFGDKVTVAPAKISDWMYSDDGKLVGGTTIRVLYNAMSDAEKADFQKSFGMKME